MPTLQIGRKEISYELRRSAAASGRRITVTPGRVEVLALTSDNEEDIAGFLGRKRQWLFNTVREMERVTASRHVVPRFITGAKIPYRGRKMALTVRRTDGARALVIYRNGFIVDLPYWIGDDTDHLVASEIKHWLKKRVRRDVKEIASSYSRRFGLTPRSIRAVDLAIGWGSCGPEGHVLINWHLVFAPMRVLEYVIAHELSHLRYRSHGSRFRELVNSIFTDAERAQGWLDKRGGELSSGFLTFE